MRGFAYTSYSGLASATRVYIWPPTSVDRSVILLPTEPCLVISDDDLIEQQELMVWKISVS